jgi:hypothetical protein
VKEATQAAAETANKKPQTLADTLTPSCIPASGKQVAAIRNKIKASHKKLILSQQPPHERYYVHLTAHVWAANLSHSLHPT